ncbi:MAG: riboflavin biosynthesis protein RibF [Candidatus Omnitrophica bacterium]|nr:riboflavin biosynthesis protein RibF [Candidatus Omnitrophota bacterium]
MRLIIGRNAVRRAPRRAVVTIGMFDGVHVGHQRLIRTAARLARRAGGRSVVITFDPDPQQVLAPRLAQPRLMPLARRVEHIRALGADVVWVIPFTRAFSTVSAEQFVCGLLVKRLRVLRVVVGPSFAFGRARRGTVALLRRLAQRHGFRVVVVPPVIRGGAPVSSSRVRRLVRAGAVEEARHCLGRPVELFGTVVRGERRGRLLGFPTANVRLVNTLLPPAGVYHVRLRQAGRWSRGLMNLGVRPTFLKRGQTPQDDPFLSLVCEVHLVGFRGNLYGSSVRLELLQRLRAERRFGSPAALVRQIRRDLARARLA